MARPLRVEFSGAVFHVTSRVHPHHGSMFVSLVSFVPFVDFPSGQQDRPDQPDKPALRLASPARRALPALCLSVGFSSIATSKCTRLSLEEWELEEGRILCRIEGKQYSTHCPKITWGRAALKEVKNVAARVRN